MLQQLARLIIAVAVCVFTTGVAQAVSLGKIDVASGLGEAFYAEIPLTVDAGENLGAMQVDIASAADYRILEIYRDPALNQIRVDVESDSRGTRVELISSVPIDAPFFNLVLRVQQDRATHFKKFPIFLDLPRAAKAPAISQPLPTVKAVQGISPAVSTTPTYVAPAAAGTAEAEAAPSMQQEAQPAPHGFQPYEGWARIGRYGPMVYGDTITTVAERLRVDDRFSRQQVMVALFEKNRAKFDQDNINLIKAGTYLDVPTAAEVERVTSSQATQLIAEHEKRWKELTRQPRYAAVEEAQRTRYSKRIRIGEEATGTAPAPMGEATQDQSQPAATTGSQTASAMPAASASTAAATAEVEQAKAQIEDLNQQNQELQTKLAESEKKLAELAAGQTAAPQADAAGAAAQERIKKLELQIARLQAERDAERDRKVAAESSGSMGWLTWVLGGAVIVLLGAVAFLLRREPKHPGMAAEDDYAEVPAYDRGGYHAPEPQVAEEEVPEIEVEEADIEAAAGDIDFGESTMRISPEDAAGFSDSIPDLTDEDTSEMEAFQEEVEEEPDPNVDYLSEADVYLRYGMEEEAMQQVRMALKQDATNPEAYGKLAQIQRQMGDQQGFDETVATAKSALAGDGLERFNAAISSMQEGEVETTSLEDTLPPTEVSELIGEDADQSAGETGVDLDSTMSELDGIDFGDVDEAIEEPDAVEAEASVADEDLAFDLSDITTGEESAEAEEVAAAEQSEFGGGLDFDLSEFEMPESDKTEKMTAAEQVETSVLPETVAMDWSQDTSVDSGEIEISGESGIENMFEEAPAEEAEAAVEEPAAEGLDIGGLDFDFGSFGEEAETKEEMPLVNLEVEEAAASTDEGDVTTLDLGEGDLDAGMDLSEIEVEPADDFSSTIRTSTMETVPATDVDFTATGEHDLHMIEEATGSSENADSAGDALDFDFGASDDVDATQQLEDLLSEFSDEDDKKKD